MTTQEVHEIGVRRHGAAWLTANQRAVDALTESPFKSWDRGVKDTICRVVLKVLDGVRLDAGEEWLKGATGWTPRAQGKS